MAVAPDEMASLAHRKPRLNRRRTAGDVVTQFVLPLVALSLLGFAGWYVWRNRVVVQTPPPPIEPARSPFAEIGRAHV